MTEKERSIGSMYGIWHDKVKCPKCGLHSYSDLWESSERSHYDDAMDYYICPNCKKDVEFIVGDC